MRRKINSDRQYLIATSIIVMLFSAKATAFDYDSADIGSIQSQYQSQLKQPKRVAPKKAVNNSAIDQDIVRQLLQPTRPAPRPADIKNPVRHNAIKKPTPQSVQPYQAPAQAKPIPHQDRLFEAATNGDIQAIRQLLSQGVNVNATNHGRESALHMAAAKGHYSVVIYLLNHGANINARTVNNWFPIHHATRFRHANIVNYLLKRGASPHHRTSDGKSALDMAKATGDRQIMGVLGIR